MTPASPPTTADLTNAREDMAALLHRSAAEADFQALFARCPYLLSRALPLRLQPADFQSIARLGRSDPDFIFYPRSAGPLWSFGVVELKRPQTVLLTSPRKELVILSRDAATAVAQGQDYCRKLHAQLAPRLSSNLIIGANDYVFVIAGLTDELVRKLTPGAIQEALHSLLPARCQIIPYDELLRRYESSIPPSTFYLIPVSQPSLRTLVDVVAQIRQGASTRQQINDDNMDFWCNMEDRWRGGCYIGTGLARIIDRQYWCVTGTDELATESPAHVEFPMYVRHLVASIESSLQLHQILARAQGTAAPFDGLSAAIGPGAFSKLSAAIQRCRTSREGSTWMESGDSDVDLLARMGLVRISFVDGGEFYYYVDSVLLQIWPKT